VAENPHANNIPHVRRPAIEEDEIREVEATLRSGWIGTGPRLPASRRRSDPTSECRTPWRPIPEAPRSTSPPNGRRRTGDEVITTAHTFCATVNAIIHTGAKPVLVDVDRVTQNIDPEQIASAITAARAPSCRCTSPAAPATWTRSSILPEARRVRRQRCRARDRSGMEGREDRPHGDASCFSFYVTKNITTIEGGMISTAHEKWAQTAKIYALHGLTADAWKRYSDDGFKHYEVTVPGFKYNMTDVEAAIGLQQLARIERWRRADARSGSATMRPSRIWPFSFPRPSRMHRSRPSPLHGAHRHRHPRGDTRSRPE